MALFCEQSEILNKKLLIKNSHLAFMAIFLFLTLPKFYTLFYAISDLFFLIQYGFSQDSIKKFGEN
jgi:hypothetical protein